MTLRASPAPLLLLLLSGLVPPAVAADPVAPPPSVTQAPAQSDPSLAVETDLRAEYLAGAPLGLTLRLRNTTTAAISAPDLTSRPWLVEFVLTPEGGQVSKRRTTAPATDPGRMVSIPPRGQRISALEVPLSNGLKPGAYTLAINVDLGGGRIIAVPPAKLRVAAPVIGAADFVECDDPQSGASAVFAHQGATSADLYLLSGPELLRPSLGAARFLAAASPGAQPRLSVVRAGAAESRHLLWVQDVRRLRYARVEAGSVRGAVGLVDLPWPKVELIGAPATDGAGLLQVPLWIPAPKGSGGELRLLTVDERGRPVFRRLTSLAAAPVDLSVVVDDAGAVHIAILVDSSTLDLYTVRPGLDDAARTAALPIPGRRARKADPGEQLLAARPILLPTRADQPGGRALLVASTLGDQLRLQTLSFKGEAMGAPVSQPWAAGSKLLALSPDRAGGAGLLVGREAATQWLEGGQATPVKLPAGPYALCRDAKDVPLVRSLSTGLAGTPLRR